MIAKCNQKYGMLRDIWHSARACIFESAQKRAHALVSAHAKKNEISLVNNQQKCSFFLAKTPFFK